MSLQRHPLSAAWPDMAREDFDALVLSIEAHGLREPITLLDGQVLDGWHRYQACESLGIEGATVEFVGTIEEADALVSDRHTRRNITPGQRAVAVLAMFNWRIGAGRPKESPHVRELTTGRIAEKAGVSVATIERAKEAIKADPQAIEKIRKGEATATSIIKEHKPAKQEPAPEPVAATSDPRDEEIAALREQLSELTSNLDSAVKDIESMARVFEASDQLAAAVAEAKRYREQARIADERIRGLMGEKNTALSQAKMWMNKFRKLEKEISNADSLGVAF